MINLTLAINPLAVSKNALDFASFLARLTDSTLTAAVLENKELAAQQDNTFPGGSRASTDHLVNQAIKWFKEGAMAREISHKVHRDRGMPFNELITESRFADVLVIHPAISFSRHFAGEFTPLAEDILRRSECPVFVVTSPIEHVDEILLAYDRSASSLFALKLFLYLFPMLAFTKCTVVHVEAHAPADDVSQYYFKEWLKVHCHGIVEYVMLEGDTGQQLLQHLQGKQNAIVIMGGYKRSKGFPLRTKSYAEWIIRNTALPVFVTHR